MMRMRARRTATLLVIFCIPLFTTQVLYAQSERDLKKDIESLKEGQKSIQKELDTIKDLLLRSGHGAPYKDVLSTDGAGVLGARDAPVTMIEFSDYQCPFCRQYFQQAMPQLLTDYVNAGKVKYVFRDFPLENLHPLAFRAAEAARCAGEQGKYWEMHDRLFTNQRSVDLKGFSNEAQALNLDIAKFQQCLESGKFQALIRNDLAEGQMAGIFGTPAFFLGFTEKDPSTLRITKTIRGAFSYAALKQAIDSLLASRTIEGEGLTKR